MSIVLIEIKCRCYVVDCPALVAENIKEYQRKFDAWIRNRNNDHGYLNKKKPHTKIFKEDYWNEETIAYDEDAFVDWLNRCVLHDNSEKAKIICSDRIDERDKSGRAIYPDEYNKYPHIFFQV